MDQKFIAYIAIESLALKTLFMKCCYLLSAGLLLLLASCDPSGVGSNEKPPASVQGYAPVYEASASARLIKADTPRNIVKGGKIYVKGSTLYQVEIGKGIHVINIADAANPVKKGFIQVLGCQELSIKGDYLYTNNLNDLVAIDISNIAAPQVKDRVANTFHIVDESVPPTNGWYECTDAAKGTVIGWELKTLEYPQCRKIQ